MQCQQGPLKLNPYKVEMWNNSVELVKEMCLNSPLGACV